MVFTAASRAAIKANEKYWAWKFGLRICTIIACLVGVGTTGWALDEVLKTSDRIGSRYYRYNDDAIWILWALIPLGVSILWNTLCVLLLLIRRRPVHPGAAVGIDLILWLSMLAAGLLTLIPGLNTLSIADYFWDRNHSYYYRRGLAVVARQSDYSSYIGKDVCEDFGSCDEADAFLRGIQRRGRVEVVAGVASFIALALHFTLFVWACVDTHRRNRLYSLQQSEVMAQQIVARFRETGHWGPADQQQHHQHHQQHVPMQQNQQGYQQAYQHTYQQDVNPHREAFAPAAGDVKREVVASPPSSQPQPQSQPQSQQQQQSQSQQGALDVSPVTEGAAPAPASGGAPQMTQRYG